MAQYAAFVDELEASGFEAAQVAHGEAEVGRDALTTRLMLALRTTEGVSLAHMSDEFGPSLGQAALDACAAAATELPSEWIDTAGAPARFALSEPEGLLFSNDAISTVFARLDEALGEEDPPLPTTDS